MEGGCRLQVKRSLLAKDLTCMCMCVVQDKGYEIVASFGDQWSDLAGTSAAEASFKLPNPFYYIL